MRTINETKMDKDKVETQSSLHIRNLQEKIDQQTLQLEEIKQLRATEDEKHGHMGQQFEVNNRLRIEAEAKAARLLEENEKLYTNYDVLKEHELNIIKDFQDRRKADQQQLKDQIEELKSQLSEKDTQLNDSRQQINDLEGQLRK